MSLSVAVVMTISNEDGSSLVSIARSETVLPLEEGMTALAGACAERVHRLVGEVGHEFDRQVDHLRSLTGEAEDEDGTDGPG